MGCRCQAAVQPPKFVSVDTAESVPTAGLFYDVVQPVPFLNLADNFVVHSGSCADVPQLNLYIQH